MIEGVDYAFSRPSPAALVAAGKHFAVRYLSGGRSSKDLTAGELKALRDAGLNVCLVWETSGGAAKGGRLQGIQDAKIAMNQRASLGMASTPVYFAVDFDAQGSTLTTVVEYVKGAASVLGYDQTGVYGGIKVIEACYNAKACKWLWETYAWSYGKWHPAAQLQQYKNGQKIGGAWLDYCRATVADYGQFPRPVAPTAAPATPPKWGGRNIGWFSLQRAQIKAAQKVLGVRQTGTYLPVIDAAFRNAIGDWQARHPKAFNDDGKKPGVIGLHLYESLMVYYK